MKEVLYEIQKLSDKIDQLSEKIAKLEQKINSGYKIVPASDNKVKNAIDSASDIANKIRIMKDSIKKKYQTEKNNVDQKAC